MTAVDTFSGCGTLCGDCEWFKGEREPHCPGCSEMEGKPFWGSCSLYSCIKERDVEHCGLCDEFPCDRFIDAYDPSKGPRSAVLRAGILAYRARHGDAKAVELFRKIAD
jgi:hypothetical protein